MKSEMERDILKVLVTEEELKARITEMGAELYEQFHGKNPLFLGVLKGSFVFMADLVRACQVKSDVEFIAVSSYQNATVSSGRVQITHDLQQDITGRHLIIVEDILDSGNTLAFLKDYFMTKGAASITIVTLLDKPSRRTKAITADLAGRMDRGKRDAGGRCETKLHPPHRAAARGPLPDQTGRARRLPGIFSGTGVLRREQPEISTGKTVRRKDHAEFHL